MTAHLSAPFRGQSVVTSQNMRILCRSGLCQYGTLEPRPSIPPSADVNACLVNYEAPQEQSPSKAFTRSALVDGNVKRARSAVALFNGCSGGTTNYGTLLQELRRVSAALDNFFFSAEALRREGF